jgi:HAMP domain-containing protein
LNGALQALRRWVAQAWPKRLAQRLLVAIFFASTALALVAAGVQSYGDYNSELQAIEDQFAQIERSTLGPLANSVWSRDETQIRLTLNGLLQMRDVELAEVRARGLVHTAGALSRARGIERVYPLRELAAHGVQMGTLRVQIGLDGVYRRLFGRAAIILATELAKAFFVALFIVFLVDRWITRHLEHMARYARDLSLDRLGRQPLQLDRPPHRGDELDQVAAALNDMSRELGQELNRRAAADEERGRLFTPYYTTKQHGTGLGLAIVQSVVADHHGTIRVDSAPGRGATFSIDLPTHG